MKKGYIVFIFLQHLYLWAVGQESLKNGGWFSLGMRSSMSLLDEEGFGVGAGGQFRLQFSDRINSDWFADYFIVSADDKVKSEYYHIGWSILYYPFKKLDDAKYKIKPYVLAGHCFDYNRKTVLAQPDITKGRWGSAVQAGIGTHFNLTKRFDISLLTQYMIHLTKSLELEETEIGYSFSTHKHSALEGHLLTTLSLNYKICRLWHR